MVSVNKRLEQLEQRSGGYEVLNFVSADGAALPLAEKQRLFEEAQRRVGPRGTVMVMVWPDDEFDTGGPVISLDWGDDDDG
jgi:hypothetical protein